MESRLPVLVLVRDLIMSSRITATARAAGVGARLVREPAKLRDAEAAARLLIVDLNEPGAFDAADEWRAAAPDRRVVGFVAHVDAEIIRRARERFDRVLPRSAFVERVEAILRDAAEQT